MAIEKIVVSDSTTIISLLNIQKVELLYLFAEHIVIPVSLYDEICAKADAKQSLDSLIKTQKISTKAPSNTVLVDELLMRLDMGESEAICLSIQNALPLIIDEKRGKNIAKSLGVQTIGLVGIILLLKRKSILKSKEIAEVVDMLDSVGFRISSELKELLV